MNKNISPEEVWKLYQKLPQELKDVVFEEDVGNTIRKICSRHNLEDEFKELMKLTTEVLLGLLPPQEFKKEATRRLSTKNSSIDKVCQEVARFVFFPIKEGLASLYNLELKVDQKKSDAEKDSSKNNKSDDYRESIE